MSTQVFSLLPLLGNYHWLQLKHWRWGGEDTLCRKQSYAAFERDPNTFSTIDLKSFHLFPCSSCCWFYPYCGGSLWWSKSSLCQDPALLLSLKIHLLLTILNPVEGGRYLFWSYSLKFSCIYILWSACLSAPKLLKLQHSCPRLIFLVNDSYNWHSD